jgi:hypothetical protein
MNVVDDKLRTGIKVPLEKQEPSFKSSRVLSTTHDSRVGLED